MQAVQRDGVRGIEMPRFFVSAVQMPLAYLSMLIAFLGFFILLKQGWQSRDEVKIWGVSATTLLAGYGVMSIGNTSYTRYTVVFDPVAMMLVSVAVYCVLRSLYDKIQDE